MSAVVEIQNNRVRLSDPKPAFCSACAQGAVGNLRFVDMDAYHDGGTFVRPEDGAVLEGTDDLHLCEACVRSAASVLGFKPDLHARQSREIRELEGRVEHWRAYAKDLEAVLEDRPEPAPSAGVRGRGRRDASSR
jgi:hypothetical protein